MVDCRRLFFRDSSVVEKCGRRSVTEVRYMRRTVLAMERGQWTSIQASELKVVIEFDEEFDENLWLDHAAISKEGSQDMLVWVAEEKEIAELLDDDGEVLKAAFGKLGALYGRDAVLEGMKNRVDRTHGRNFFEIAAVNRNDDAFKNAHDLLKAECEDKEDERVCMKDVYCSSCADTIFGRLNGLGLGEDVERDGELHKSECSDCQ